jgi:2-polyprenyl-6-methoxyphenol hydroxylase-like FAD-dependent oxidoreductase
MSGEDYSDVLVVGAGPVGLVLASEPARRAPRFG